MAWSKSEWNRPIGKARPIEHHQGIRGFRPRGLVYMLVIVVAILAVGGILWWRSGTPSLTADVPEQTKSVHNPPSTKSMTVPRNKSQEVGQSIDTAQSKKRPPVARNQKAPSEVSAADRTRQIIDAERQKQEAWRIADSNRLAKSEAILAAQAPRKFFDNEVDNTLEVVSKPGAQFLILPQVTLSQQEVLEFLKAPIVISDDDDDESVAAKRRTAAFKEQALDYIAKGGTLNQFIREQAAAAADEHDAMDEIRREKDRILVNEGPEAAKAYLDKINPELRKLNMPQIRMGRADISKLRHQQRMLQQQKQEK